MNTFSKYKWLFLSIAIISIISSCKKNDVIDEPVIQKYSGELVKSSWELNTDTIGVSASSDSAWSEVTLQHKGNKIEKKGDTIAVSFPASFTTTSKMIIDYHFLNSNSDSTLYVCYTGPYGNYLINYHSPDRILMQYAPYSGHGTGTSWHFSGARE